jgi:hypothetical protein
MQIGEVGGVRAANVAYENRSLVGRMPHEQDLPAPSSGGRSFARRIDSYAFPEEGPNSSFNLKLPALCFGKRYFFFPYLIGHGGSLPVFLRDDTKVEIATNPQPKKGLKPHDPDAPSVFIISEDDVRSKSGLAELGLTAQDLVRWQDYFRITLIGMPRIVGQLPGIPDGVEPLASEIPIRPSAITIGAKETAFFYCNRDKTDGILDLSSADATKRAIQVDFGGLPKGTDQTKRPDLRVVFKGRGVVLPSPLVIPGYFWPTDQSLGVRLVVASDGAMLYAQQNREMDDPFVERLPVFGGIPRGLIAGAIDLSSWEAFFIAVVNDSGDDATLLPPVVTTGSGGGPGDLDQPRQFPLPEAAHHQRVIAVLDGIDRSRASPDLKFTVRRPAVEFSTYERWVNWDLTDKDITTTRKEVHDSGNTLRLGALNEAHELVSQMDAPGGGAKKDLTIDDPAVEDVIVELVELFPYPRLHGRCPIGPAAWSTKEGITRGFSPRPPITGALVIKVGDAPDIRGQTGQATITLDPGGVFEVRLYAATPEDPQSVLSAKVPAAASRFGKGVWQGMLKYTGPKGDKYRLGAPLVLTFEVATAQMPFLYGFELPTSIDRDIDARSTQDRANIVFRRDFILLRDKKTDDLVNYPHIRYVNLVSLYSQRWGWRGRPLGTLPAPGLQPMTSGVTRPPQDKGQRLDGELEDFETIAFMDRRDDDIGVIEEAKLDLSHVMPSVDTSGAVQEPPSPLFRKDLQYRGGANWWRFALGATSRYAPMKPGNDNLMRYSHVPPKGSKSDQNKTLWDTLIVRDRETGRTPKRPALLLLLPLTETIMSDTAVPPLLAIFSEPMFANNHIGDGIEAALEYARYPLADGRQRYWPEIGPDPTLTSDPQPADPHSGEPVAIRLDGPIGYTFDFETEAPKFGRSGFLITPATPVDRAKLGDEPPEVRPWTFAKLRFRRIEALELTLNKPHAVDEDPKGFLLSSAGIAMPSEPVIPAETHEGIALVFPAVEGTTGVTVSIVKPAATQDWQDHKIKVTASISADDAANTDVLQIQIDTDLGKAGRFVAPLRPTSRAWLRAVLSQRDKPEEGDDPYSPVVDVSVRLLIDDGDADGLVRSVAGTWITVGCVPLLAGAKAFKPNDPVFVSAKPDDSQPANPVAYGVRLTPFTAPLWCQFTQDVSVFDVMTPSGGLTRHVSSLTSKLDSHNALTLYCADEDGVVQPVQAVDWLRPDPGDSAVSPPKRPSQIGATVAAVVTEFITDVFDRVRERPIAVYRIKGQNDQDVSLTSFMWPSNPVDQQRVRNTKLAGARVRLMSLAYLRLDPSTSKPPASLTDFFNESLDETIEMSASDAVGRILGVSKPIEVG